MKLAVQALTDRGLKRETNQDFFACWIPEDPAERDRRGVLLVVADGMGGARGGDVASRLAVNGVVGAYRSAAGSDPLTMLTQAVEAANRAVHDRSLADPALAGMGTTCTAAVVRAGEIFLAHVGDSRAYLIGREGIRQLTRDHSLVAHLVEQRSLTPEEARVDPRRNLVTRSLGLAPEVEVDGAVAPGLGRGDTLLLCSDGLHGSVTDPDLREAVAGRDLEAASRDLIALANRAGGPDNITVILARFEEETDQGTGDHGTGRGREAGEDDRPPAEPRAGLARHRRRAPLPGWLVGLTALLAPAFALLGCSGDRLPPLTIELLEANRRLWQGRGISSYDLDVLVTGTGFEEPETIHLEVRSDSVTRADRGGTPMTGSLESYSVPGLLSTLAQECELARVPAAMGAPPGYQVYLQARFHPELGYPLHYRRIVGGSNRKIEIRVTRFESR